MHSEYSLEPLVVVAIIILLLKYRMRAELVAVFISCFQPHPMYRASIRLTEEFQNLETLALSKCSTHDHNHQRVSPVHLHVLCSQEQIPNKCI